MTGGGFGGSAIALVPSERAEDVTAAVREAFAAQGFGARDPGGDPVGGRDPRCLTLTTPCACIRDHESPGRGATWPGLDTRDDAATREQPAAISAVPVQAAATKPSVKLGGGGVTAARHR